MQATDNQTLNDFIGIVYWLGEYVMGITNHDRVEPGTLEMKADPTTLFGWYKRFNTILGWTKKGNITNPMFWSCLAVGWSYIFDPNQEFYYDNFVADLQLNSGKPEGIFAIFDLFTVNGLGQAFGFYILQTVLRAVFEKMAILVAFLVWFSVDTSLPLCKSGEYDLFGMDMCSFVQAKFYNGYEAAA